MKNPTLEKQTAIHAVRTWKELGLKEERVNEKKNQESINYINSECTRSWNYEGIGIGRKLAKMREIVLNYLSNLILKFGEKEKCHAKKI